MRGIQKQFFTSQKETEDHNLFFLFFCLFHFIFRRRKLKELEQENENLKTTFSSTFPFFPSEKEKKPITPTKKTNNLKTSSSTLKNSRRNL